MTNIDQLVQSDRVSLRVLRGFDDNMAMSKSNFW